ncbi:Hypothetical predicted protein [Podarcis lilfordi]|uniref:Uncharacterized protein n=1 Tax=Podarcis lilfordi TaxID=74358 RepID=A0AA35L6L9_9SAUR|nr:Hypothetical predicted protein [Podarcis lilfordi]
MHLLLLFTFLSLLCLPVQGWVLKKPTQNEQWKTLDRLQNRELFLSALQSYLSTKGIQVERTAPPFVLLLKGHNARTHGELEGQELVIMEPEVDEWMNK